MVVLLELVGCSPAVRETFASVAAMAPSKVVGFSHNADGPYQLSVLRGDEPLYLTVDRFPVHLITATYDPALSLEPGPITGEPSCKLMHYGTAARGVILDSGEPVTWTPVAHVPELRLDQQLFGEARLDFCAGGCWAFEERELDPPIIGAASFASVLGVSAVIGYDDGAMSRIESDGSTTRLCERGPPGTRLTTGVWVGADTVWLGFEYGQIARLQLSEQDPSRPCLSHTVTQAADRSSIRGLATAPPGEPFELFVLSSSGASNVRFQRWDGERYTATLHYENGDDNIETLRLGPGYAMATLDSQDVAFIQDDNTFLQPVGQNLGSTLNVSPQSLTPDGLGGAWVGAAHLGLIHFSPPRQWDAITHDDGAYSVSSVVRFDDRTFYTSSGAISTQIRDRGPECVNAGGYIFPLSESSESADANFVQRLGPDQLLVARAVEFDKFGVRTSTRTVLMRRTERK